MQRGRLEGNVNRKETTQLTEKAKRSSVDFVIVAVSSFISFIHFFIHSHIYFIYIYLIYLPSCDQYRRKL